MKIKNPYSLLALIMSIGSMAVMLNYFFNSSVIRANESVEQSTQGTFTSICIFSILSIFFLSKSKHLEKPDLRQKISLIIILMLIFVFVVSMLFYLYFEITK